MATLATPASAEADLASYGMCLLHADFHPMSGECWAACLDFNLARPHLPDSALRDLYQAEVERAMLDTFIRTPAVPLTLAVCP